MKKLAISAFITAVLVISAMSPNKAMAGWHCFPDGNGGWICEVIH